MAMTSTSKMGMGKIGERKSNVSRESRTVHGTIGRREERGMGSAGRLRNEALAYAWG